MKQSSSDTLSEVPIPNTPLRFISYISRPHKWWAILAIVSTSLAQVLGIIAIYIISVLVDEFSSATLRADQLEVLWYWGMVFFLLTLGERLFWRVSGFTGIKWLVDMHATGNRRMYQYLLDHSHTYFINRFAGSISNKISHAVDGGTRLIERLLWNIGPEILSLIVSMYFFFLVHWTVGVTMLGTILVVVFLNIVLVRYRHPHVVAYSKSASKLKGEGVDLVTNISAVRQYSRQRAELSRLDLSIVDQATKDKRQWFMGEWLSVMNTVIGLLLTGAVLAMVYVLLQNDMATTGNFILMIALLGRVGFIFATLGNMMNGFIRMYGEVEEGLGEVLVPYEIIDHPEATALAVTKGEIAFNHVTFEFGANQVFDDFALRIEGSQRVGLVGTSGAGKTTFVSLLLRQHDLGQGSISIDGQNIRTITQASLRSGIAVVPQEPALFHRSILENIAYGKPEATEADIIEVAKKAQAHEFIHALPEGYQTLVGERGVKLSGGQKQRIAIARAMLKDAPILVLDEATSALDSESEVAIQKALHVLMVDKTVIAIAHRLSTLREMDRIIVLDAGKIIEDGNHESLSRGGGTYQRLWEHQAGGFLLE